MSWPLLPVDYTDAVWSGLKRYNQISNQDGTVSLQDVTQYSNKEKSFFGALDANRMNEALNTIMSMVEDGTDLYEAFQNYFNTQKGLFEAAADATKSEFDDYTEDIKIDYREEMDAFESQQQALFTLWFDLIKGQLSQDAAGNLQNQINALDTKTDGFDPRTTVFSQDGTNITETYGVKRIETEFVSSSTIIQRLYENNVLALTKTITFNADGSIDEEVN